MISSGFTSIKHLLSAAFHVWRDARLPRSARVLFLIGLVYVFAPCDWCPDSSAIGYLDDLGIVILVGFCLKRIIPKVILQDARRAAAGTACGILCLNLFAPLHLTPKIDYRLTSLSQKGHMVQPSRPALVSKLPKSEVVVTSNGSINPKRPPAYGARVNDEQMFNLDYCLLSSNPSHSVESSSLIDADRCTAQEPLSEKRIILWFRGGQRQVYSSDDDFRAVGASSPCHVQMPSFVSKGGIIITPPYHSRNQLESSC
jgi:uncharacterized membrane protein YkvA (DUF1232 family)